MSLNNDFDTLAWCAFRYALGRKSYVVNCVVNALIDNVRILKKRTQTSMVREINKALEAGKAGMDVDVLEWRALLEVIKDEEFRFYNDSNAS